MADLPPSDWIRHFAGAFPAPQNARRILDLAAGGGRHARLLRRLGHNVLAVDRDISGLADLIDDPGAEIRAIDLETGPPYPADWPLTGELFAGIVVTNYLHRPLLPALPGALAPGGVLLYETFAIGNERFGRPSNPDFLLRPGELPSLAAAHNLVILDYFHGETIAPKPAVIQRLAARRPDLKSGLDFRWPIR